MAVSLQPLAKIHSINLRDRSKGEIKSHQRRYWRGQRSPTPILLSSTNARQLMADPGWGYVPVLGSIATPWSKGLGRVYQWLIQPVSILDLIDRAI
jgi:hypothetical protein